MVIFLEPMRFGPQNFGSPASQIYPPFDWHHFRNISWWVEYRPLKWSSIGFSIGPTGNPCRRDLLTPFSVDFSTTRAPTKLPSELMAINKRDLSIDTNFEQFCENGIDPIAYWNCVKMCRNVASKIVKFLSPSGIIRTRSLSSRFAREVSVLESYSYGVNVFWVQSELLKFEQWLKALDRVVRDQVVSVSG